MSFSQKIKADWVGDGREIAGAFTVSANAKASFDENIPIGAANEYVFAFDITNLELLYISVAEDLTIKTNSSGAPDDTILVKKGIPFIWTYGVNYSKPLAVDVVKIFVANSSGVIARLQIEVLYNAIEA